MHFLQRCSVPTTYTDQFYLIDPANPPAVGSTLTQQFLDIVDRTSNGTITRNGANGDSIDGSDIVEIWPGDTITVVMNGSTVTITGVTFRLADGRYLFTPSDGTNLDPATFVSSTFVSTQGTMPVGNLGPPCFTAGTRIRVPGGTALVEELVPGSLVETMDHGAQELRWVGQQSVEGTGELAPVKFARNAIGNDRPLLVSPQHRMLVAGWMAELYFGQDEVLVAAKHLVGSPGVVRRPMRTVTYVHLLFDNHEIVFSEGAASESFHPGSLHVDRDTALRDEIAATFPELLAPRDSCRQTLARPQIAGREARVLTAA
ncbi:MAG: Hint domain-containing protein [Paracoccaceae bacterium]|nr:Hint domain-containing protein [Paracoccaceae bacterium]